MVSKGKDTKSATAAPVAVTWKCKKRDGAIVDFDPKKIRVALFRCFNAVQLSQKLPGGMQEEEQIVKNITTAVLNVLKASKKDVLDVEQIQQFTLQQLWGAGLFEAAEHYQNYREQHRKARESKPIAMEVIARVKEDQKHFSTDLQYYQFMSKFSRWKDDDKRRETWKETVYDRVMPWLKKVQDVTLEAQEWAELGDALYNLEASPAMRVVQMAGPALDRCHVGVYNCAYQPMSDIRSFSEILYILMQGTGAGFSCEDEYVSELPRVKRRKKTMGDPIIVEDSTEGWCDAYNEFLTRLWDGYDSPVDTSRVRKKNTRLRTKGGRASGPEPFLELIEFARNLLLARQGRTLEDIDVHDLTCMTGKIVQVGGVRRAAEISLSDLTSTAMRNAKSGNWWDKSKHRSMANNSAVYDYPDRVPMDVFISEWTSLYESKSGERGIFNRQAALKHSPKRRKWGKHRPGCNPCAEILLRPHEFCNLSMAIARKTDTVQDLERKVRIAAVFGKIQSMCTKFNYIREDWAINCREERLLGVDITGQAECPLLQFGAPGRAELLRHLAKIVEEVDHNLSKRWNVNISAANTTVKPGGDSAVFFHCGSGISPWFSEYQKRWVREAATSPISKFLIDSGVPYAPAPEAPDSLLVFGFPKNAPEGAVLRNDMTAKDQFYNWLEWKQTWAEHSVSATIYVEDHEWLELGALVYQHMDHITGLSFLPKDNGSYTYAPNEELTQTQYEKFSADFPELNWAKLVEYEDEDMTESAQTFACTGQGCD